MLRLLGKWFGPKAREVQGVLVDHVWLDPKSKDEPLPLEIQRDQYVQKAGFLLWCVLYYLTTATLLFSALGVLVEAVQHAMLVRWLVWPAVANVVVVTVYIALQAPRNYALYKRSVRLDQEARTAYGSGNHEEARWLLKMAIRH